MHAQLGWRLTMNDQVGSGQVHAQHRRPKRAHHSILVPRARLVPGLHSRKAKGRDNANKCSYPPPWHALIWLDCNKSAQIKASRGCHMVYS